MKDIGLHEIRHEFLEFFEEKNHLIMDSFSLVPQEDKSLLLVNAGMAPLKPYFTGEKTPPNNRIANCQKCIRTGDIENVGKTDRHATFFEMLGNFSFGDYFKKEAIEWAWEFLTKNMGIPEESLWATVFTDDDEAFEIWKKDIGIDKDRILRLGKEHNFWELEVGPCGPSSEIYVDRGEDYSCEDPSCQPGCECDRFVEVWNLVFTQYDKDEEGNYNQLNHPNIDTGMGLERIASVLQGTENIFEIEAIKEILNEVEKVSKKEYGKNPKDDTSIRIITDHCRAMTFLVSDGVVPSNEGRGYVLRRLIRRASRHGKLLGINGLFLNSIVKSTIESWKVEYSEISKREDRIKKVIKAEEKRFQETIDQGIDRLEEYIVNMNKNEEVCLNGEKAFKLYDTYGFPLDLTREILEEKNLKVDEDGFNKSMEEQRNRARKARAGISDSGWKNGNPIKVFEGYKTDFVGYETISLETKVTGISQDGEIVDTIREGQNGFIVLKQSPFYAESGGQIGDSGYIENDKFKGKVIDTQYTKDKTIVHNVEAEKGSISTGDTILAKVNGKLRNDIIRNHSATHILHRALKDVLGEHVNQAGSIVLADRLRFDFNHYEAVSEKELKEIEKIVNSKILESLEVKIINTKLADAKESGVVGLFEDAYGDKVRVVRMGDYSKELCGGTHVGNTSNIGLFKILSESSIASGVRRIEAITGNAVYEYLNKLEENIDSLSDILKTNQNDLINKVHNINTDLKEKEIEIQSLKSKMASSIADEILDTKKEIDGINYIIYEADNMDMNSLRNLGDELKDDLGSGVIVLASVSNGKVYFVSMATKDMMDKGIHVGNIIKEVASVTGGNGGGRPDMAQAGGKDESKIKDALDLVPGLIESQIKQS